MMVYILHILVPGPARYFVRAAPSHVQALRSLEVFYPAGIHAYTLEAILPAAPEVIAFYREKSKVS